MFDRLARVWGLSNWKDCGYLGSILNTQPTWNQRSYVFNFIFSYLSYYDLSQEAMREGTRRLLERISRIMDDVKAEVRVLFYFEIYVKAEFAILDGHRALLFQSYIEAVYHS